MQLSDSKQPLLDKKQPSPSQQPKKRYISTEMSPIERYNLVVNCYNLPSNLIDGKSLNKIGQSSFYNFLFRTSTHLWGKILFVILCLLPGLNLIMLIISFYYSSLYCCSLGAHEVNKSSVPDPFKKMTFDPELCYTMGCDYYSFNIELKELEGFSLNYEQKVKNVSRLNLRKERGTTSLTVYNANFWASFSYFDRWKMTHYLPLLISVLGCLIINFLVLWLIIF